ncbi:MAG: nucleotidyltransferase domain-containing protein [Calditrichota bacterium]
MKQELQPQILTRLERCLRDEYRDRLSCLILFGSQARGDAEDGSDIDVLVVLKGKVSPGLEVTRISPITASLSLQYDVVISCVFVSEKRYQSEMSPLLMNVRREGVAI